MQAVYEIMEIPRTLMNSEAVFRTMKKIVREEENKKRNKGTSDNGENGTKEPKSELNLFRK